MAEARWELVAFCDPDDVRLPHALTAMVERYDELRSAPDSSPIGLVYGWYQEVLGDGTPTGRVEARDVEGDVWSTS